MYEKQKQSLKTLWTDQTKINLYQNDRNENVCRREGTPYELKYIPSSGKHSGDSVIVWACVSASGTGPVVFLIMWLHKEVAGWILMCTRLFIQWIEGSLQCKWVTTQKTKHSQTTQQFLKAKKQDTLSTYLASFGTQCVLVRMLDSMCRLKSILFSLAGRRTAHNAGSKVGKTPRTPISQQTYADSIIF